MTCRGECTNSPSPIQRQPPTDRPQHRSRGGPEMDSLLIPALSVMLCAASTAACMFRKVFIYATPLAAPKTTLQIVRPVTAAFFYHPQYASSGEGLQLSAD